MRKSLFIIIAGLLATGCASTQQNAPTAALEPAACPAPAVATTLAFNPQVNSPTPMLARDLRDLGAAGGFEDAIVEIYDVQTDDDQLYFNGSSNYERRVLSDRVGVTFH